MSTPASKFTDKKKTPKTIGVFRLKHKIKHGVFPLQFKTIQTSTLSLQVQSTLYKVYLKYIVYGSTNGPTNSLWCLYSIQV